MRGDIIRGTRGRHLLIVAAGLLGLLLMLPSSAWAKTTPELALRVVGPSEELAVSSGEVRATQSAGGVEAISISSATPSVCEVRRLCVGTKRRGGPRNAK